MDDPGWPETLIAIAAILLTAGLARLGSIGSALSRATLERLKEEGMPRAGMYLWLYRSRDFTTQMVAFAQIVVIGIGAMSVLSLLNTFPVPFFDGWIWVGQCIALGIYTLLALLFRSVVPPYRREEGSEHPLPKLPILFLPVQVIFFVPTLLLQKAQSLFVSEDDTKARKEEELRSFVEMETEEGTIEAGEREMIEGIFEFRETTVREVMVPRIDIVCAEMDTPANELLELIKESRHSRLPVYEERIDNIKGVIYVKDLLFYLGTDKTWTISEIMRAPYFVPENKKLDELMAEFKKEKIHMAIVVGEYGGTSGLVTMEDIIEEIVGEIQDEYDEEEPLFQWRHEGRVLIVDARIDIEDLNEMLNVELPQDGYETLGGFIYNHLGHVPETGETLEFGHLVMIIKEVDGQRITRVRIEKREIDTDLAPQNAEIA